MVSLLQGELDGLCLLLTVAAVLDFVASRPPENFVGVDKDEEGLVFAQLVGFELD